MPLGVKCVDHKQGIGEKLRLPQHTVRLQSAGKIINNNVRSLFPTGVYRRKYVIASLCIGDAVEAVTDAVWTPHTHQTPG